MSPTLRIIRDMQNMSFEFTISASSLRRMENRRKLKRKILWMKRERNYSKRPISCQAHQDQGSQTFVSRLHNFFISTNFKRPALNFMKFMVTDARFRGSFGFIITFLLLFSILSFQNAVPTSIAVPVVTIISFIIAIIFFFSKTFRCVMILSLPHFGTQQGRFVLLAIITSILIGGPLDSFNKNFSQFRKSADCMVDSSKEQVKDMARNYMQSYDALTNYYKKHLEHLQSIKKGIDDKLEPVKVILRNVKEKIQNLDKLFHDASRDCHLKVEQKRVDCVLEATRRFNKCKEVEFLKITQLDDLCELTWISTDVCENVIFDHKKTCFPVRAAESITSGIKIGIQRLQNSLNVYLEARKKFKANWTDHINVTNIKTKIRKAYTTPHQYFMTVCLVIEYLLLSSVAWIPIKSWLFLRNIQKRKSSNFGFLDRLPRYNERQRRNDFISQVFLFIIHFLFSLLVFATDYVCYWIQISIIESSRESTLLYKAVYNISINFTMGSGAAFVLSPLVEQSNFTYNNNNNDSLAYFYIEGSKCMPDPIQSSSLLHFILVLLFYILILVMLVRGNQLLKYRISIIHFIMPELKSKEVEDSTLIPYTSPLSVSLLSHYSETNQNGHPIQCGGVHCSSHNNGTYNPYPTNTHL